MLSKGSILRTLSRAMQGSSVIPSISRKVACRDYSGIVNQIDVSIVYTYGIGTIGALGHDDYEDQEFPKV